MQLKKFLSIVLVAVMLLSCLLMIVACDGNANADGNTQAPTQEPTQEPTQTPTEDNSEGPTDEKPTEPNVEIPVPTQKPDDEPDEEYVEYTVIVRDQNGNAVPNVKVMVCLSENNCFRPVTTDENGKAVYELEEMNGYKAKISATSIPGYEFSTEYVDYAPGAKEVVIVITKLTEACEHTNTTTVPGTEKTCTTDGKTESVICDDCGEVISAAETIPAGHTPVELEAAVDATCKITGKTAKIACSVCDEILQEAEIIPTTEHTPQTLNALEPTCTKAGKTEGSNCSACGDTLVKQETIAKLGHTYEDEFYGTTCTRCGADRKQPTEVSKSVLTFGVGKNTVALSDYTSSVTFLGASVEAVDAANGAVTFVDAWSGVALKATGEAEYKNTLISEFGYYYDNDYSTYTGIKGTKDGSTFKYSYDLLIDTTGLSVGSHTIHIVAKFSTGYTANIADWEITIVEKYSDTTKPTANVIIISGQSNAYGASPITNIKAEYENKTYSNVYIHFNNINLLGDKWQSIVSNDSFEQYKIGLGGQNMNYIGPELGIVDYLVANGYTDDAPLYIIKFTAAGTFLNGQWFPTVCTNQTVLNNTNNCDPSGLVEDMGDYLYNQMYDYINDSLAVIAETYNPQIQSFFWVQGESDAGAPQIAEGYEKLEKQLVSYIRSDFLQYAADDGISFINYAIQETAEAGNKWPYPEQINEAKENNAKYYFDPEDEEASISAPAVNDEAGINNSYLIAGDILESKQVAGEEADPWHLSGASMLQLGQWMGEAMLYLESINNQ